MMEIRKFAAIFAVFAALGVACGSDDSEMLGGGAGSSAGSSSGGTSAGTAGWGPTADGGCTPTSCTGHIYECGNCTDDDGDGRIDWQDNNCLGPCDNTENHLYPDLPGTTGGECKADCFWDNGNGSGNDDCYWDHQCDPLEKAPGFPPEGPDCAFDDSVKVGPFDCTGAFNGQTNTCLSYCEPLVPNGCDCFGCCQLPGAPTPVWLGSVVDGTNDGTCTIDVVGDPAKCKPCTMVPGCGNGCGKCEVCIGKPLPDPDCVPDGGYDGGVTGQCPAGVQPCGLQGQALCPGGSYCITGCCRATPS